jgi:hypothetical protein
LHAAATAINASTATSSNDLRHNGLMPKHLLAVLICKLLLLCTNLLAELGEVG